MELVCYGHRKGNVLLFMGGFKKNCWLSINVFVENQLSAANILLMEADGIKQFEVEHSRKKTSKNVVDDLAIEEPLEMRVGVHGQPHQPLSITMRTPGRDEDLTLGFLFTEGMLKSSSEVASSFSCGSSGNVWRVELSETAEFDSEKLKRNFYTTSSCGVCGKSSIEALKVISSFAMNERFVLDSDLIAELPKRLRERQPLFELSGGLHGAGLFNQQGELIDLAEDVGRHNAVDKLIGRAFKLIQLPLTNSILVLSGRASFELMQKAKMAGIPAVVAVGAPSSLAVELAQESKMILVGFVRGDQYNVYSERRRVKALSKNT